MCWTAIVLSLSLSLFLVFYALFCTCSRRRCITGNLSRSTSKLVTWIFEFQLTRHTSQGSINVKFNWQLHIRFRLLSSPVARFNSRSAEKSFNCSFTSSYRRMSASERWTNGRRCFFFFFWWAQMSNKRNNELNGKWRATQSTQIHFVYYFKLLFIGGNKLLNYYQFDWLIIARSSDSH